MKKTISIFILGLALAAPAFAAEEFVPIVPLPNLPGVSGDDTTLTGYLNIAFNLAITIGAVAAVGMIVWGGYEYLVSEAVTQKKDGKARIWQALTGLALLLLSWLILYQINPDILSLRILSDSGSIPQSGNFQSSPTRPGGSSVGGTGSNNSNPRPSEGSESPAGECRAGYSSSGLAWYPKGCVLCTAYETATSCDAAVAKSKSTKISVYKGPCVRSILSGTYSYEEKTYENGYIKSARSVTTGSSFQECESKRNTN